MKPKLHNFGDLRLRTGSHLPREGVHLVLEGEEGSVLAIGAFRFATRILAMKARGFQGGLDGE